MAESKVFKRIPAQEANELIGWDLPQVSGPIVVGLEQKDPIEVTVVEEEIAAEKITVAELEEIRETARIEGLSAGLEEGRKKGLEEGTAQGKAEGIKQGYEEGLAQGQAEINKIQAQLASVITEFELPISTQAEQLEEQLLGLVVMLSEAVVGVELEERKDLLLSSIRESLQKLPEPLGRVMLRINSADRTYLEQVNLQSGVMISIEEDDSITSGSYELETENTLVEHRADERFSQVLEQFMVSAKNTTSAESS